MYGMKATKVDNRTIEIFEHGELYALIERDIADEYFTVTHYNRYTGETTAVNTLPYPTTEQHAVDWAVTVTID